VPWFDVTTVEQELAKLDGPRRFQTTLITAFAGFALVLAALGLYGLVAYWVDQRTREIGIRVALGAGAGRVTWLVLRQSLAWALAGMAAGTAGALAIGRVLSASLFGIGAHDPPTFAVVVLILLSVSAIASILPARRATTVDPTIALRHE
jgi:ABC-type antimicrobial peptide transport system permease subunit